MIIDVHTRSEKGSTLRRIRYVRIMRFWLFKIVLLCVTDFKENKVQDDSNVFVMS